MVTLRPGAEAKASILSRFIHPKLNHQDKRHRTDVVLINREQKKVNGKTQTCYSFKIDGNDSGQEYYAVASHFKVTKEGPRSLLFDPPGPNDDLEDGKVKEPRIKWKDSRAKRILYEMLMEGIVPVREEDEDNPVMSIKEIYMLHEDFALYDASKFNERLQRLRNKIIDLDNRASDDLKAFENYKKNHEPAKRSHKGYIQWQGSCAQELLWEDLEGYLKDGAMKPKDLWMSRPEYRDEFPLDAFRDKIKQEIRTDKYIRTLEAREEAKKKKAEEKRLKEEEKRLKKISY